VNRTRAYWPTRILLAVGIVATGAVAFSVVNGLMQPCLSCERAPAVLGLPSDIALAALGIGLAVVGLVWMLRIFRGPHDEAPAWRYRDH
jgi:hypothetical protein